MSLGRGAEALILNQISGLGAETIVLRPGQEPSGPSDFSETLFADSIKNKDIEALRRRANAPHIVEVMPALVVPASVSYEGETFRPMVLGGVVNFFSDAFNVHVTEGRPFNEIEIDQNASVAVIGHKVKQELFGESDALNEYIKIKDRDFRVVGIFPDKGQVSFFNVNELVIIPYTTAQLYLLGVDYYHEAIIKVDSTENVARTVRDIELTLRESHGITDPEDDDFFVVTQEGVVEQVKTITGALTIFLSSVVAIALVVGGIGVMNIMLVSVTERTREIGLRKALGATERDIMLQFLFEAVILTAMGGIIGILLGGAFSLLAAFVLTNVVALDWVFTFPISAAVLGLSVSAFVGLVFGIYPAREAAKKSPIEALRYE
jgi:putative ABC transport system permease protein